MSIKKVFSLILLAALMAPLNSPAFGQSTVLTGKVSSASKTQKLISQSAAYAAPVTTVRTQPRVIERTVYRPVYVRDNRTYFQRHPKVKSAAVGAGVGTAVGGLTGLISGRGVVRGAAIGAGTGAGVGLIRSSDTLKRHPIARNVSSGALAGLGIGAATGRHGSTLKGAGIGAAVGLGASLLQGDLR